MPKIPPFASQADMDRIEGLMAANDSLLDQRGILIRELQGRVAALKSRPSVVGALPANPADGDEVYYRTPAPSALWHLRFDQAMHALDGYGWEYVGGAPLRGDGVNGSGSVAQNTWFAAGAGYAGANAPLAGYYDIQAGTTLTLSGANVSLFIGLQIGGVNPTAGGALTAWEYLNTATGALNLNLDARTLVTAGALVAVVYLHNLPSSQTLGRNQPTLSMRPYRVKA